MSKLSAAKRRHIVAAYVNICDALRRLEEAALEGRSPTGTGAPLTPLPHDRATELLRPLCRLREQMRQHVAELAPAELAEVETAQSPANTLVWVANLLDVVREAVDGVQPSKVRKYGPCNDQEKHSLEAIHRKLSEYVSEARCTLERLDGDAEA